MTLLGQLSKVPPERANIPSIGVTVPIVKQLDGSVAHSIGCHCRDCLMSGLSNDRLQ